MKSACRLAFLLLFALLAPTTATAATAATADEPLRHVRIAIGGARAVAADLERAGFDVLEGSATDRTLEVVVSPAEMEELAARGYALEVIAVGRPFREIQAERRAGEAGAREGGAPGAAVVPPGYLDLSQVVASLQATAAAHPAICQVVDLTLALGVPPTVEGRHIYALKISDQVTVEEDEPAVLVVGAHHCREIVTPVIALNAIDRLVTGYGSDPQITGLVDAYEIWIAPVWNPDGYAYVFSTNNLWRKNRRVFTGGIGVDLNRNYPQGWSNACSGSTNPSSETYKGPSPASEAETQTMIAWSLAERFAKILDYHSYGREVIYSYACWTYPFDTYLEQEAITLANVSGYAGSHRAPSADGEQYQLQFATLGSHAFLIETHTQFQPAYASAQAEATQLWPGILWMLDRPIPLWGHVTDAMSGGAVAAAIHYQGVAFPNGETNGSGGAAGRYQAFLPPGTYTVVFEAGGYQTLAVPGVVVTGGASRLLDVALTPDAAAVADGGAGAAGGLVTVAWRDPALRYELRRAASVSIRVFDVRGALVRALAEGPHAAGSHEVAWPAVNAEGQRVASGVYYYRVRADDVTQSGKIAIVR